jgi:hypothetical protein
MAEQALRYFELRTRAKYEVETAIFFETGIESAGFELPFCGITPPGLLYIDPGFVWDGPSGPTVDREWNMKASLKHDPLVKLLRHTGFGLVDHDERQLAADRIYLETCLTAIEDLADLAPRETAWARFSTAVRYNWRRSKAHLHYRALRIFGASAGELEGPREILTAI